MLDLTICLFLLSISPVIFDGGENNIGKIVNVKIQTSNQNTLFGSIEKNMKAA